MDFDVLPGPGLAEVARTVMARACAAVVNCLGPRTRCMATIPMQVSETGQPILRPRHGPELARGRRRHERQKKPSEGLFFHDGILIMRLSQRRAMNRAPFERRTFIYR